MELLFKVKQYKKLRSFFLWTITSKKNPRPRLWIRWFVNPFVYKIGKGSHISIFKARLDLFPWHRFEMGKDGIIEDYAVISNGAGDLILGDNCRIGIRSVVLGPVKIGSGCGLGQNVFIAGFNHGYKDASKNSSEQELDRRPVIIDEDTHIGSNSVVVAGVHIGKRCQLGAGSVVTKDIPDYCIAAGNPARIIKTYDFDKKEWIKVPKQV